MAFKLKILLVITAALVGGLLLFSSGTETRNALKKPGSAFPQQQGVAVRKVIATPFSDSFSDSESQLPPGPGNDQQNTKGENSPVKTASGTEQTPLQLIDAYMTAWSGGNRVEINRRWGEIGQCPDCLQTIKDLLMNQGVPKGMLLELTYRIIELGDESMLPVFDYLLQPTVDLNTRVIVTQQMIKDGRDMYVRKLFDILQQADLDGYQDYAQKHAWMISKLKNPQGIAAIFDVISGRGAAPERFVTHVRNVFNNTLLGIKQEGMAGAMVDYYLSANDTERENLWGVISLHSESMAALAKNAFENGNVSQFKKYTRALADINSVGAIEDTLGLVAEVDYSQEYFIAMISELTQRFNSLEVFRKLEDYVRNPNADMRTRIVAAEGLLAVKQSEQARYILEKVLGSNSYEDSEIAAYISARL